MCRYKGGGCCQLTNAPDTVLSIGNSLHESYDLQNLKKTPNKSIMQMMTRS